MQNVIGDLGLPNQLALDRKGGGVDRLVVEEIGEDELAIASERGRSEGAFVVAPLGEAAAMRDRLPKQLSRLAMIAKDRLRFVRMVRRRQEYLVADDDGRTVSAARDRRLPGDVL